VAPYLTYHLENFGCRATQADGATIERQLLDRGLQRAGNAGDAEVVILNTARHLLRDQDARAAIRRIHREIRKPKFWSPLLRAARSAGIVVLPGVSLVVGNSHKHELANYVSPLIHDTGFVPLAEIGSSAASNVIVGDIFATPN